MLQYLLQNAQPLSQNASLLQNDAEHKLLLFIGFRTF